MEYEYKRRSSQVLNLTPLIDIVFLLLVFFMLTAHFIEDEAIDIQLPVAESSLPSDDDDTVEVALLPNGDLLVDGRAATLDNLEDTLRGALHAPSKRYVRLKGDQAAAFGAGVKVIDAARSAGAESLDILTEKP
ncbi:MAG: biopolymer transporter ExbD [Candidatus Thiodiazotropha endolucinida]|uniref:Biopolymer transporter ExbD n=1 Tax=Candidatus Thiodiazotropha taylori TaxID=2792791 RepID=A0A9E4NXR4_9GAMM|nr:biopolymer transporter ExbD [Candidatus Thiodiazotropha taylori]MBT3094249.1 biopolymer transporter ExbD [Candidatus Thiodiazotropha sp. (ex Lucina pensylvanica)]MCG7861248.1 biopolymer transporter ExbD [Candidatus Thiodiazotropha endolucinida]MCG7875211.1 biopolymer transporter ExbD [Candidatus Thiodiazotropha taylori]MCG7882398.1 biopolymer transporter ExbD [Candidatus Thiodiazotropha taylori]